MFATRYVRKRDAGRGGAARFAKDLRVTKVSLLALTASYSVLINYKEVFCGRNLDAFRSHVSVAKTIRAASPCDSRERCDFLHRLRDMGEEFSRWRNQLINKVTFDRHLFVPRPSKDKLPDVKAALDQGITELREIGRIVSFIYGLPNNATNTGNTRPLDPRAISHKATVIPTTTPGT